MTAPHDPARMSPAARLAEIAQVFAIALRRLEDLRNPVDDLAGREPSCATP